MHSFSILALPALFGAIVSAVPMAKRDVVWVTETDVDIVKVAVTKTVWVDASGKTQTPVAAQEVAAYPSKASSSSKHVHGHKTSHIKSTVTVTPSALSISSLAQAEHSYSAPEASSSSSVYVAPSVSSVYVAPTTSSSAYVAPTTSSSAYVAPTTSSSVYVAPTTSSTSVYVAPTTSAYVAPTTSEAATSTSTQAASSAASADGATYTGELTWYNTGMGSCGITNADTDMIVALAEDMMLANWSGNPNSNPLCGSWITITYNGVSKAAQIMDTCPGCSGASLDLSPSLFADLADPGLGHLDDVTWCYGS